jgi:uncharacterized protein
MIHRKLTEIWIYPIKSLPGIQIKEANVLEKGLEGDRRMMLVDENNKFITQRLLPKMALFQVTMDHGLIQVASRANNALHPITIDPTLPINSAPVPCTIWDDTVDALEMGSIYSKWFSEALNMSCKLMLFPEGNKRRVDEKYVPDEKQVSLADGYPYLIIGTESLKDLSTRVGAELSMRRFRPNFIFEGGAPYEEDKWKDFHIGPVKFRGVKPCGRCVLITVNPETGERGAEPLKTLATYRTSNHKVQFGQNVVALSAGFIKEGDDISIHE